MHDVMEETGKVVETSAQRRLINADSFRRLTALLKKPQAVAPSCCTNAGGCRACRDPA